MRFGQTLNLHQQAGEIKPPPKLLWTAGTGPTSATYDGTSLTWAESTTAPVTIRFE